MGDASKIRDLTKIAREVFLSDADRIDAEKPKLYDLETEFAKTRANRSLLFVLLVAGFIVVAVGVTVFLTLYIDNQNRKITVDIGEFTDVNLRELLSTARKNEDDLANAQQSLKNARQELQTKMNAVKNDISGRIAALDAQGLSKPERDAEGQKLLDQQKTELAALSTQYSGVLKTRQTEIADIQKKIDAYDQKQVDVAKKQEEVLNNQQRLHELQLNQTKTYYEAELKKQANQYKSDIATLKANNQRMIASLTLKYNPVVDSEPLKTILSTAVSKQTASSFPDLSAQLESGKYVATDLLSRIRTTTPKRLQLFTRLATIPYVNSVPSIISHLDDADRTLTGSYEEVAKSLLSVIKNNEARIGALNGVVNRDVLAFQYYARMIRENGFIIDARNTDAIAVFVAPSVRIANGNEGFVFRSDNEYIATIRFSVTSAGIGARLIELASNKKIAPFDKFLIRKVQVKK